MVLGPSTNPVNDARNPPSGATVTVSTGTPSIWIVAVSPGAAVPAGTLTSIELKPVRLSVSLSPVSLEASRSRAMLGFAGAVKSIVNSSVDVSDETLPATSVTSTRTSYMFSSSESPAGTISVHVAPDMTRSGPSE